MIAVLIIVIVALALAVVLYLDHFNFSSISTPQMPIPFVSVARNWAGYAAFSSILNPQAVVTSVSASWIVPSAKDIGTDAFSSVWVGIGGEFDGTLIQIGTEQDFTGGSPHYYAWYEMIPNNAVKIDSIQVAPGDQIEASISLINQQSNTWSLSINDVTSNKKFQSTFNYNSKQSTAEWIVERPQVNNALVDLANFGSITFTNCNAVLSGKTGGITAFPHNEVVMDPETLNGHSLRLVTVSGFATSGTQFTVKYVAAGA